MGRQIFDAPSTELTTPVGTEVLYITDQLADLFISLNNIFSNITVNIIPKVDAVINLGDPDTPLRFKRGYFSGYVRCLQIQDLNENKVIGAQQPAIPDTGIIVLADVGGKVNEILAMLRVHGLIAT